MADTFEEGYLSAIADLRWLADRRDEYTHVAEEVGAVCLVAAILDGKNDAVGWLPSWRWDEWAARKRYPLDP